MGHRMPTFTFHLSWVDALRNHPIEIRNAVFDAVIRYASTGEEPKFDGVCLMAFDFIRREMDVEYEGKKPKKKAAQRKKSVTKKEVKEEPVQEQPDEQQPTAANEIILLDEEEEEPKQLSLLTRARLTFEEFYRKTCNEEYYWEGKDVGGMKMILNKLTYARKAKGKTTDDDSVIFALTFLLEQIGDPWVMQHLSVAIVNSKYNEIVSNAYKEHGKYSRKREANTEAFNAINTDYSKFQTGMASEMPKPF